MFVKALLYNAGARPCGLKMSTSNSLAEPGLLLEKRSGWTTMQEGWFDKFKKKHSE